MSAEIIDLNAKRAVLMSDLDCQNVFLAWAHALDSIFKPENCELPMDKDSS